MSEFRKMIADELREKRPNISDSSEKTYASTLFSLNKKMAGDKDLDFFKKHTEILQFIKENMANKQTQKTLQKLHNTLHNIYKILRNSTQLYKTLHNSSQLFTTLHKYTCCYTTS